MSNFNASHGRRDSGSDRAAWVHGRTAVAAIVLGLSGTVCGPVNAGSAERAEIASVLFDVPVAELDGASGVFYDYNPRLRPGRYPGCRGYDGGHSGIDLQSRDAAGQGPDAPDRQFHAVGAGKVIAAGGPSNLIAVFDSTTNVTLVYLHARRLFVSRGDTVAVGDRLGIAGMKGGADGVHVHLEARNGQQFYAACGASTTIDVEAEVIAQLRRSTSVQTVRALEVGRPVTGSLRKDEWAYYEIAGDALAGDGEVRLDRLDADLDLYVGVGARPTFQLNACKPYEGGTTPEECSIMPGARYVIGIHGYAEGSYQLTLGGPTEERRSTDDGVAVRALSRCQLAYADFFGPPIGAPRQCGAGQVCQDTAGSAYGDYNRLRVDRDLADDMFEYRLGTRWKEFHLSHCD